VEAAVLLDPDLSRSLELEREDRTSDTGDVVAHLKTPHQAEQPLRIVDHVVIAEGHEVASSEQ
jgi:hypothetical protein